jgi:dihydrofolate synthase/folylpolyglutamate synthase
MDFGFSYQPAVWEPSTSKLGRVAVSTKERAWPSLEMALMGRHQAANAAVVVAAVARLRKEGLRIPEAAVARGLADVRWPARMEIVGTNPLVLLDCAHNVASVEALLSTLDESFPALRRSLVFAGSADKDLAGMLGLLARSFDVAFFTRYASSQRGAPPETLAEMWRSQSHHPCEVLKSPAAALAAAREWAGADGLICVTGSVFLAGELRAAFRG